MSRQLWNPDDLDRMRMESDPLGDATVAQFENDIDLAALLLDSLVRTGDATPETSAVLRAFQQKTRDLPEWADKVKISRAQRLMTENLIPGTVLLAAASLPQCYLDHLGAPVLTATHQLTGHVFRRLIQTSHMVFTVYDPGSLFQDASKPEEIPAAIQRAQTVRLIHALMRQLLLCPVEERQGKAPRSMAEVLRAVPWDVQGLGKPINQEDEAFVLLTFSFVVIKGFETLAMVLDDEDKDSILHLWNVVGHIMGVHDGLMAHTYADAKILYALFQARLRGRSEAGHQLTKALVDWINSLLPRFLSWFDAGGELIHLFNGAEDAALLGTKTSGSDRIVHAVIGALLPSCEKVAHAAGRPHPFTHLVNFLAKKMVQKVWAETEQGARQIDWPDHVRVTANK